MEISIPAQAASFTNSRYIKVMERAAWSFALVSAAVRLDWQDKRLQQGRIVLGGVAGTPWRPLAAEKLLDDSRIDDALARRVGDAAVSEADPLEWNAYKIPMVKNLVKRALLELNAEVDS